MSITESISAETPVAHVVAKLPKPASCWSRQAGHRRRPMVAAVGLLALLLDQNYAVLPIIVGLAAAYMPGPTVIRRLAMTIPCLFGLNAIVLTVFVLAGIPVNARLLAAVYLVLGGLFAAPNVSAKPERDGADNGTDWWALGTALTIFAIFYRPFATASLGERLALLSYSTDAGNHLKSVRVALAESGYQSLSDYPPAWAGNLALAIDLLIGKDAPATSFIHAAAVLIILLYALLVYFAVALVLTSVQTFTGRLHPAAAGLAVVAVGTSATFGSTSVLLMSASYAQIVATTVLLAMGCLQVAQYHGGWRVPTTVGLLSMALMQTWYLLAPVLAALLLAYLATLGRRVLVPLLLASPLGVVAAYPILKGPGVTHLSAGGGTYFTAPSVTYVLFFLTLAGVAVLVRQKATCGGRPLALLVLVVTSLILTAAVVVVQILAGQGFGYYAIKLLLVVFLFGTLAVATAVAVAADRAITSRRAQAHASTPLLACLCIVGLLLGGVLAAAIGTLKISFPFASGSTPPDLDGRVLDAIFAAHPTGLDSATDAWVVDGCSRGRDHIANKWIHDIFLTWNASRQATDSLYFTTKGDNIDMLSSRAADSTLKRMEIYVRRDCQPIAVDRLAENRKVTVIRVD